MIKAKHQFFLYHFFRLYGLWRIRKNFDHVEIDGSYCEKGGPILIIANHISWWDGFWVVYFREKFVKRRFYFMMLEEELKKNIFLKYAGGYSINKKSRTIVETIRYTQELLQNDLNMVLMFPQGRIESLYKDSIHFEKGIHSILEKAPQSRILFIANFIDFCTNRKPTLFLYVNEIENTPSNVHHLEEHYNTFYTEKLNIQKQKTF